MFMKKIIRSIALSLCLIVCFPIVSKSYNMHPYVRMFSVNEGLSHGEVTNFSMDKYGRMWISTGMGFNVLNNGNLTSYTHFANNGEHYLISKVFDIVAEDFALVSTESGLLKFNPLSNEFSYVMYEDAPIIVTSMVKSGKDVFMYVPSLKSLLCYNMEKGSISLAMVFPDNSDFIFEKMIIQDPQSPVLIMADASKGVFQIDVDQNRISKIETFVNNIIPSSLFLDSYDILWGALHDGGIQGLQSAHNFKSFAEFNSTNSDLSSKSVMAIAEMPNTDLIVTTNGDGAYIIPRKSDDFINIRPSYSIFLTAVYVMNQKEVFIGTARYGVVDLLEAPVYTELEGQIVNGVYDNLDGSLWCIANPMGLIRYYENIETFVNCEGTENLAIQSLCNIDDNTLLLQVKGGLLYEYDINRSLLRESSLPPVLSNCIVSRNSRNEIFVLSSNGNCFRYNPKTKDKDYFNIFSNENEGEDIINVFHTERGASIVVTKTSIYELDQTDLWVRKLYTSDKQIISSVLDRLDNIWFVTIDGLHRFSTIDGTDTQLVLHSNLPSYYYTTLSIDKTKLNRLYLTTSDNHVIIYNPVNNKYVVLGAEDCLLTSNSFKGTTCSSVNGNIYLPGSAGLTIIPTNVEDNYLGEFDFDFNCLGVVQGNSCQEIEGPDFLCKCKEGSDIFLQIAVGGMSPADKMSVSYFLKDRKGNVKKSGRLNNTSLDFGTLPKGYYDLYIKKLLRNGLTVEQKMFSLEVSKKGSAPFDAVKLIAVILLLCTIIFIVANRKLKEKVMVTESALLNQKKEIDSINSKANNMINDFIREEKISMSIAYQFMYKILNQTRPNDPAYLLLKRSCRIIDRMSELIFSFDQSKLDLQDIPVNIDQLLFNHCINSIVKDYRMECKIKNITVKEMYDPSISQVNMDRVILDTIFTIVFHNIVTHMQDGIVSVHTSLENSETICLYIRTNTKMSDSEIGELQLAFDSEQIAGSTYFHGLYKANMLVKRMGGLGIECEENASGGVTFRILLPNSLSDVSAYHHNQSNLNRGTSRFLISDSDVSTLMYSILVVDDNTDVLEFFSEEFSSLFWEVYIANSGAQALEIMHDKHPNIVVSDVIMPGMSGLELCKRIKSDIEISHTPVLLRTAKEDVIDVNYGYKTSADKFVPKQVDLSALYYEIKDLIKERCYNEFNIRMLVGEENITNNTISVADEKFMLHFDRFIQVNLSDQSLNSQIIANEMNLSEALLNNKVKAITGVSSQRYLRLVRIAKAKELLSVADSGKSIFDISSQIGFPDCESFMVAFKQETGFTPQEYRAPNIGD